MKSVAAVQFDGLLAPDEPPAADVHREHGTAPVLFVADHASKRIPRALANLGLTQEQLDTHIGWDIGTDIVAQELSRLFDARLVMANYSRLVVDLNRSLTDLTVMAEVSDGIPVPGNGDLSEEARQERVHALYVPYRQIIDAQLQALRDRGIIPALIAIHSFTPVMAGRRRPWQIGVLWDKDPRIPLPFMEALRDHPADLTVGDNEPYSGRHPADYTIDHHAEAAGLPHVSIEIRQDLTATPQQARHWAHVLYQCLQPILAADDLYTLWQG